MTPGEMAAEQLAKPDATLLLEWIYHRSVNGPSYNLGTDIHFVITAYYKGLNR